MRPQELPKFRETKYPHRRSEGTSHRWNRGLRELDTIRAAYEWRRDARTPTHPDAYPTRVGLALDRAEDRCQSAHHERGRRLGLEPRYPSRYHRPQGARGSNPS